MANNEDDARARYRYLQLKQKAAMASNSGVAENEPRQAADLGEALITDLPTSGLGQNIVRGLPATAYATLGGMLGAPLGPLGVVGGAALGGMVGEGARQAVTHATAAAFPRENYPSQGIRGTASSIVGQGVEQGAAAGIGLGIGAMARQAPRVISQIARAASGTPEKSALAVLSDPGLIGRALPMDEAGAVYAKSTGGLKSGVEASREVFGKSHFSGEAIADKFDELLPKLKDGTMDAQTALALRQQTMKAINDLPFNQRGLSRVLSKNIEELDSFLEPKLPDWGAGRSGYRDSKIAEDFSSWLPQNKNLSPNVLRTGAALATAAKSASEGSLAGMAAIPVISPKVWGVGLRAAGYAGKAATSISPGIYQVGANALAGARGSAVQDAYLRQTQIAEPDPAFSSIGGMRPATP